MTTVQFDCGVMHVLLFTCVCALCDTVLPHHSPGVAQKAKTPAPETEAEGERTGPEGPLVTCVTVAPTRGHTSQTCACCHHAGVLNISLWARALWRTMFRIVLVSAAATTPFVFSIRCRCVLVVRSARDLHVQQKSQMVTSPAECCRQIHHLNSMKKLLVVCCL